MTPEPLFRSFFHGGFECATHRARSRGGERIDMIAATRHDTFAREDYERMRSVGMNTARDGLRWHLVERAPGVYDWSSALPLVRAARDTNTQVVWDLLHYGYPDFIDIFAPDFVTRFAAFAHAFARLLKQETDERVPFITPINEISYFAWAGGTTGWINPFAEARGDAVKRQLIRASIEATEAVWSVFPEARVLHCDPAINVTGDPALPATLPVSRYIHSLQYEAWDMLAGLAAPELGGAPKYLDIVGVNYYWNNQWTLGDAPGFERLTVSRADARYRPLRLVLADVFARYRRPLYVAETGIEDDARAEWFAFICDEVHGARAAGVPVEGVCLYPIVNHPGWDDDRHCYDGLWDYADEHGGREIYEPLADELRRQQRIFEPATLAVGAR